MKHLISGKVLAIDIGSRNTRLVEGRFTGNRVDLYQRIVIPTPEGSVKNGSINDPPSVQENLRQALRLHKISSDKVILTIKNPNVISRDVVLPTVQKGELGTMIQLEMEQYVPSLVTDYVLGFTILEQQETKSGIQAKYRAVAVPKQLIQSYTTVLRDAGLKPVVIDVHANAISKLIDRNYIQSKQLNSLSSPWQTAVFIDLGYDQTEVIIVNNGIVAFTRLIPFGSRQICSDLSRQQSISLIRAEEMLSKDIDLQKPDNSPAQELVRAFANRWINEVQITVQFYAGRSLEIQPEAMYIYGGFARLKGMTELMSRSFSVPVHYFDQFPVVRLPGKNSESSDDLGQYANVIGALIRNE